MKKVKLPRDPNQRAKVTLEFMLGEIDPEPLPIKDSAAVESGRRGGLIGGRKRADSLSPERRTEIARKAAAARWAKNG